MDKFIQQVIVNILEEQLFTIDILLLGNCGS